MTTITSTITELPEDRYWWFASRVRAIFAVTASLVGRNLPVLDIGCGADNMMHHLARFGPVKGVAIDPHPLKLAQERGYDVKLSVADLYALPLERE